MLSAIRLAEWKYPGAAVIGDGVGGGVGGGPGSTAFEAYSCLSTSTDGFDAVCAYFVKRAGVKDAGGAMSTSVGNDGSVSYIDDSGRRPFKLKTIVKTVNKRMVTVVISRADTETLTHIDLFYWGEFNP